MYEHQKQISGLVSTKVKQKTSRIRYYSQLQCSILNAEILNVILNVKGKKEKK